MKTKRIANTIVLVVIFLFGFVLFNGRFNRNIGQAQQERSSIDEIFSRVFNQSNEQLLFPRNILIKTVQYMIEDRDEYDPELVAFVRSLILTPQTKRSQYSKKRADFSQMGQSLYIDQLLNSKINGFFIESGGFDGETFSNSLYFELKRNWTGILIEPIPSFYLKLVSKKRCVYAINACIAGKKPTLSKFRLGGGLTGRLSEMRPEQHEKIDRVYDDVPVYVNVPCFSLNTILKAINVTQIDYFSLDIEGGEVNVLQNLDFKSLNIKAFSIEYNRVEELKQSILKLMIDKDYNLTKYDSLDMYFLKNNR